MEYEIDPVTIDKYKIFDLKKFLLELSLIKNKTKEKKKRSFCWQASEQEKLQKCALGDEEVGWNYGRKFSKKLYSATMKPARIQLFHVLSFASTCFA